MGGSCQAEVAAWTKKLSCGEQSTVEGPGLRRGKHTGAHCSGAEGATPQSPDSLRWIKSASNREMRGLRRGYKSFYTYLIFREGRISQEK